MGRGFKFRIQEEEGLYYPCSENKGADQLRGYRSVQSLNMGRGFKFRIQEVEGLYYPCRENKGADQLRG